MINITNVKVVKIENNIRVKGIASITIDDSFVIHDIKINGYKKIIRTKL